MIYPADFEQKIGYDRIRSSLSANCLGPLGQKRLEDAVFMTDREMIRSETGKVQEFQNILEKRENFPSDHYYDLSACLNKLRIEGSHPEVAEVFNLKRSLLTLKAVFAFIRNKNSDRKVYPYLGEVTGGIRIFPYIIDIIDRILSKEGTIKDNASAGLAAIRAETRKLNVSVSRRLQAVLKKSQADGIVDKTASIAIRNGRGVIPVGAYDKNKIRGLIHDQSATGKTVFIEPEDVVAMNNRIVELEYDEKREIIKILIDFADKLRPYIDELEENYAILGEIDYIRARAILGNSLAACAPKISDDSEMEWDSAVHPLLFLAYRSSEDKKVVPLDISLDEKQRILLISGPNAGGKSVCLKTVALLQYMFQNGLTVPVKESSRFRVFEKIFIDIGDEQSIDNDLSTYSSHLLNMKHFTRFSNQDTLILIDEFGTGTEPMLGAAIAEAILAEFNRIGLYGVLTTHYTNLKHFASSAEGIVNGAMLFDNHLMQPLFKLDIGKPGSSFAFEIARKIGLPEKVLEDAAGKVGEDHINFDRHLKDILRDKRYWDKKRQNIRFGSKRLDELIEDYEKEIAELRKERKEVISRAREEAKALLDEANRRVERTIKEIKEAQAEKHKTRVARSKLEAFESSLETDPEADKRIEAKIKKLREKEKRLKENREVTKAGLKETQVPVKHKDIPEDISGPLKIGDKVTMDGVSSPGEITALEGKKAVILIGNMITTVPLDRLTKISTGEYRRQTRSMSGTASLDWEVTKRRSLFKPDIDVRGMRADEAIEVVQNLVDEAIMVRYANLRILHGKGNGILRHLIREYLSTVDLVADYRDEHVEAGGSGITIVKLDV